MSDLDHFNEPSMTAGGHRWVPDMFVRGYLCEVCRTVISWEAFRAGKIEMCKGQRIIRRRRRK